MFSVNIYYGRSCCKRRDGEESLYNCTAIAHLNRKYSFRKTLGYVNTIHMYGAALGHH